MSNLGPLIGPSSTGVMLEPVRVLIVEDEVKMAGLIRRGLKEEGMAADVPEVSQSVASIVDGSADDHYELSVAYAYRRGEQTHGIVRARSVLAFHHQGLTGATADLLPAQEGLRAQRGWSVDDPSGGIEDLRQALPLLGERAAIRGGKVSVGPLHERRNVAGPRSQPLV
jgi:hypothetical protein